MKQIAREQPTMTTLASAIESELQLAAVPFDQADLIAFVECNHMLIDDAPDPALWAERFAELVRERAEADRPAGLE
jgi:hypothetical protein